MCTSVNIILKYLINHFKSGLYLFLFLPRTPGFRLAWDPNWGKRGEIRMTKVNRTKTKNTSGWNGLYRTYTLSHPCQGRCACPRRTSRGSSPCSRTKAPPGQASDPCVEESDEKVMRKWWERKWWERKWWERKLRLGRRLTPVWKKVMRGPWLHNQGFFSQRHKSLLSLDRMLHLWIGWDDALGINKSQSHRLMVMVSHHPHHNHYHHCHRGPKSSADNQSSLASAARTTISRPSGQVAQNAAAPDVKGFVNFSFSPVLR